jgi:hypothetical protein
MLRLWIRPERRKTGAAAGEGVPGPTKKPVVKKK